jgi:acyl dehydratase
VGQHASRSRLVTRRDIELLTEVSGDRDPVDHDGDVATTHSGGLVVQGGVGTAVLNAVVAEDLPGTGTVFLQLDLRFLAPVRPGDVITGSVRVTSARPDESNTRLDVRVTRDDGVVAVRVPQCAGPPGPVRATRPAAEGARRAQGPGPDGRLTSISPGVRLGRWGSVCSSGTPSWPCSRTS